MNARGRLSAAGLGLLMTTGAACALAPLVAVAASSAVPQESPMDITPTDETVAARFAAFARTPDPTLLYQALDAIEDAERADLAAPAPDDETAFARWLRFFAALDTLLDAAFDPADVPPRGVPPPPSHRGIVRGNTGEVDPADIAEPAERRAYVQALQAAKARHESFLVQLQLQRLDQRATAAAGRSWAARLARAPARWPAFERLLAAAPLAEARRHRLRRLLVVGQGER